MYNFYIQYKVTKTFAFEIKVFFIYNTVFLYCTKILIKPKKYLSKLNASSNSFYLTECVEWSSNPQYKYTSKTLLKFNKI